MAIVSSVNFALCTIMKAIKYLNELKIGVGALGGVDSTSRCFKETSSPFESEEIPDNALILITVISSVKFAVWAMLDAIDT